MSNDQGAVPPGAQVRLRYASFINYALYTVSAIFGFFFLVFVTRRLSPDDYGTWIMIWRYVGYFLTPSVIVSTWVTRDISRGKNTSTTGVLSSLAFGIASIPFYLLFASFMSNTLQQPLIPLLISSLCLVLDFLNSGLASVSSGHAPQITGYSLFTFRSVQLVFGLIFILSMELGLTEAVLAALIGRIMMNAVSIIMNRSMLRNSRLQLHQIIIWTKSSWLPLFGSIASLLVTFDVMIVTLVYRSQIPVAYYGLCVSIISLAAFASVVSNSLYPKIISKKNIEDLKEAIWLTSLLSLPIIFLIIIYAEPLCAILNPEYLAVAPSLRIMVFGIYFQLMGYIAGTVYYGLDPFDEKNLELKRLLKSALFKGYSISFIFNLTFLLILYILSSLLMDYLSFVMAWALLTVMLNIANLIVFTVLIRKHFGMVFPIKSLLKDVLVFTVPAIVSIIPSILLPVSISDSFYFTLYSLIPPATLSLAVYLCILFLIERRFRLTLKDIIKKILPMIKRNAY